MKTFLIYVLFLSGPEAGQVKYISGPGTCEQVRQETKARLIRWQEIAYVSECFYGVSK